MQAYRFTDPSRGLELKTIPIPEPGARQILVQVKAAGICHTDHNLVSGQDDTFLFRRPITLGHEIAGIVVRTGSDVKDFVTSNHVVALLDTKCPFTLSGVATAPGIGIDGGFAEYVLLDEHKTLLMPEGISFADAAVATDAVGTAYHALVTMGQVKASSKIAIIGLGGLGMCAAQLAAKIIGARVYGIELDTKKYATALGMGVKACAKSFAGLPGQRFDVVVDFAGVGVTTSSAVMALEQGGTIVLVGLGAKECKLNTYEFVANNVILKGSTGVTPDEIKICMDLIVQKKFATVLEEIPFSNIIEGIERLATGNAVGRLWADPSSN